MRHWNERICDELANSASPTECQPKAGRLKLEASMYKAWKTWFELNLESLVDSVVVVVSILMLILLMAWVLY